MNFPRHIVIAGELIEWRWGMAKGGLAGWLTDRQVDDNHVINIVDGVVMIPDIELRVESNC